LVLNKLTGMSYVQVEPSMSGLLRFTAVHKRSLNRMEDLLHSQIILHMDRILLCTGI